MIAIDDLVKVLTPEEVNESFLSILETLRMPARSWRTGGVARTILKTVATTYSNFTAIMSLVIKGGFLETATGDWLTLLAKYVYGVERRVSTFATGEVQFTNPGGGVYPWLADQVKVTWTAGKKSYVNTVPFTVLGGAIISVPYRAVEAGAASSVPPGGIAAIETSMPGVTVTNLTSIVGSDAETDDDLRQRCRDKLGSLAVTGPRGAYAYAAKSAVRVDGTPVNVNRISVSPYSSTGTVDVYVASVSGAPVPADLDYIRESIEALARPDAVTVNVAAATPVALAKTITIWARRTAGVSAADLTSLAQGALSTMIETYPIGGIRKPPSTQGYLYADNIAGTAKSAHPSIFDVDGIGSDLAINPGQVATLATTIAVSIVDVP